MSHTPKLFYIQGKYSMPSLYTSLINSARNKVTAEHILSNPMNNVVRYIIFLDVVSKEINCYYENKIFQQNLSDHDLKKTVNNLSLDTTLTFKSCSRISNGLIKQRIAIAEWLYKKLRKEYNV